MAEDGVQLLKEGEDKVLRIDYSARPLLPSVETDPRVMSEVIDLLVRYPGATKIVFQQKHEYEYDYPQVKMLQELASVYGRLTREKKLLTIDQVDQMHTEYAKLQTLLWRDLKEDPIGTYVELVRIHRHEKIAEKNSDGDALELVSVKLTILEHILSLLDKTTLILKAKPLLAGFEVGDRSIYNQFFNPLIKPDFMYTRLQSSYPKNSTELENYTLEETEVVVFELQDTVHFLYHVTPPEFKLNEDQYELLDKARTILASHKPDRKEFVDPERLRDVFGNIGKGLLQELATTRKVELSEEELDNLTHILLRYTVGFGLIEILLQDPQVQDITINSPVGHNPIFLTHAKYGDCMTNIVPTLQDTENWASKLRFMSGRPLDEANPILDTQISIPGVANARIAVIAEPLDPTGIAYAIRRHRNKPWTFPLFIKSKMMTPLAAGLLSFLIDGNRTMLVAGTRSAGKTSLLSSVMVEIMRRYRILTIEDTLELPVGPLRHLGYNIQSMKVSSALGSSQGEVSATDGIRATLRLGDSALIVGEVRSKEARALYEAMRIGALANVVAGTIHGDSPYGVFDRVVNDLEVPKTSFKATDIIVVANPVRSPDGLHRFRRITQITEVRKVWDEDPLAEKAFVDLMKYNAETDQLEPTAELLNGDSEILKSIAGNVKEWAGSWDALWENIELRAKIKGLLVEKAEQLHNPDLLEAEMTVLANDQFHKISEDVKEKHGVLDTEQILFEWQDWLERTIKKRAIR